MDSEIQELLITFEELARLLESEGDHHWCLWMRTAAHRLGDGDGSGVEYLLRAHGGMGSINDLVLGQTSRDGKFAWKPGYIALNERFDSLRAKAWQLAQDIKRSSGGA